MIEKILLVGILLCLLSTGIVSAGEMQVVIIPTVNNGSITAIIVDTTVATTDSTGKWYATVSYPETNLDITSLEDKIDNIQANFSSMNLSILEDRFEDLLSTYKSSIISEVQKRNASDVDIEDIKVAIDAGTSASSASLQEFFENTYLPSQERFDNQTAQITDLKVENGELKSTIERKDEKILALEDDKEQTQNNYYMAMAACVIIAALFLFLVLGGEGGLGTFRGRLLKQREGYSEDQRRYMEERSGLPSLKNGSIDAEYYTPPENMQPNMQSQRETQQPQRFVDEQPERQAETNPIDSLRNTIKDFVISQNDFSHTKKTVNEYLRRIGIEISEDVLVPILAEVRDEIARGRQDGEWKNVRTKGIFWWEKGEN